MKSKKLYRLTLRNYISAVKNHRKLLYVSFLAPIGGILMNVGVPFFSGLALASIITQDGKLPTYIILLGIVTALGLLGNRYGFVALMKLQAHTLYDLNNQVFSRILDRGLRFHTNIIGGKLVSDALDYLQSFSTLLMATMTVGSSFILTVLFGLIVVFSQSIHLGAFLLVVTGITITWAYYDSKYRSRVRTIRHKTTKKFIAHFSDAIVNAQTIKIFAAEDNERQRSSELNKNLRDLRITDWSHGGISGTRRAGFLLISIIGLLILINYLTQQNPSNIGIGIFAFTYTFSLILRLFDINALTTQIEEAFLNARPMTEMLEEDNEITDDDNATVLNITNAAIAFDDVGFQYTDSSKPQQIFSNLNIDIRAGEKIGIVGPSGGGKTTITRLIQRFEDIQNGQITIDGQDIAKVTQKSLRLSLGYVPQEPLLFHRSIAENIGYGKSGATKNQIISAAKQAQAHEFIEKLADKYDTIVGERGIKLSGGQRQRVAIARAILKDAPILILDEATSALDSESESLVQAGLTNLMTDRTSIVIAHRLSTVQKMDRIIVLDEGKIVEEGTHRELVKKKNGHYARLWKHQSGGFLQD